MPTHNILLEISSIIQITGQPFVLYECSLLLSGIGLRKLTCQTERLLTCSSYLGILDFLLRLQVEGFHLKLETYFGAIY
jgi:hypothetical protein